MKKMQTWELTLSALFIALIALFSQLAISLPISPVPITLQTFAVLLAALLLPPRAALISVGVYLLAGALGLPFFAQFSGGFGHILGPSGGFLVSFLPAAGLVSWLTRRADCPRWRMLLALAAGELLIYVWGVVQFKLVMELAWPEALALGCLPYLPGEALKIVALMLIAPGVRRRLAAKIRRPS